MGARRRATLIDADGHRCIDGLAGLWNNTAGHGRAKLVAATTKQMKTLPYVSGYVESSNPKAIELAERLAQITYYYYTRDARAVVKRLEGMPGLTFLHRPANLEDVFLKLTGRELRD